MIDARQLRQVADLHTRSIDRGFLSTLGPRFLMLLYRSIEAGEDSVLLTHVEAGRVVGFVSGTTGMGPIYRRMLRRWPSLVVALMPSILSIPKLAKIFETLRYSAGGNAPADLPAAELLSISVDSSHRGTPVAGQLYERLKAHFRNREIAEFRIVVGHGLDPAHRFYAKMGARPVAEIEVHRGRRSTVYVQSTAAAPAQ